MLVDCRRLGAGLVAGLCAAVLLWPGLAGADDHAEDEGRPLFDGRTLEGWVGDPVYWRVEDGAIVGEITPETLVERNTFLIYQGEMPGDFVLTLEYRITERGNSGVNYRSVEVDGLEHALRGYQCDLDGQNRYTGSNYEERGRRTLASRGEHARIDPWPADRDLAEGVARNSWLDREVVDVDGRADLVPAEPGQWHRVRIVARGGLLVHYINDQCVSIVEDGDGRLGRADGLLGVQVHVGPPMKVEFREIMLWPVDREAGEAE